MIPVLDSPEKIKALQSQINEALRTLVPEDRTPEELYAPVRYVLEAEGKRLRPILVLLAAEAYGVKREAAMPAALAVEVFHTFTLVHDDIMDHADERRGRPTIHVKWGESTAILAGDFLMGLAYELLSRVKTDHLALMIQAFHEMVARLCEGQALDEAFEDRPEVSVQQYLEMVSGKTGALIELSLELGGLVATGSPEVRQVLKKIGHHLGRAFQLQDDLLDLTARHEQWGKPVGGDLMEGKKTYLLLRTLEEAGPDDARWFGRITTGQGINAAEVEQARLRMKELGILDETKRLIASNYDTARHYIDALPEGEATEALKWLLRLMEQRVH